MGRKRKFEAYIVLSGRIPGIYKTWDETKAQTDGFPGACFHGIYSIEDAKKEWAEHLAKPHTAPKVPAGLASSISEPLNLYRQKSQGISPTRVSHYTI
jgi:viroplasmin and RNaseH domain-containing protein